MAQSNKLGVFGGVFTPSILTILGVIMFLRLPWIVGQAGLWTTIGIILLAHLVSVTSGLSVSSIATDKKVKAGGTYYIISRSLGLPIGGTLGIALFVGLSFSVSLYLIGFAESFLGFWNFESTPNSIRIVGTIALVLVTTLTFVSTSLAIKTQFFIMAAIAFALLSILFGNGAAAPAAPHFDPVEGMAPFIVLFAIFFPAVTGFEAGVSMSGDLKDPKKSLPSGTIAAIVVGLLVYAGLAIFFAFRVEPDALINDPNVLLNLSFFPPIVVAGIWGATISSAIGSILGAPRILQATSADGITPQTFARGYGRTNEPRNAVLLAFVLAEAGILIGELNVIARIVSMFFITTYGFLNLTCSIESWASTDFRPSFRIPNWVSIVGALTCLIIMIQLDILATLAATVLLAGIFMYLTRQQLRLETGDTWEAVWSSLARSALQRLTRVMTHSRNWRPNIILFSGGLASRPHLIEMGQWLVHKRGMLSNFDLIEQEKADVVFPKMHQAVTPGDVDVPGVFARRLECEDVYDSMETVAQVYGFSGLDPNTVMMGWTRNTRDPRRFGLLVHRLTRLDYNLLLLDYNFDRGFGPKERIDIWWGGATNNITLSLAMLKCLMATEEWEDVSVRLLTVIADSARTSRVQRNMQLLLENHRIEGTPKVINNAVERRPVESIIQNESSDADLIILGMPAIDEDSAENFVSRTGAYLGGIGSVLLVHASSSFEFPDVGVDPTRQAERAPPPAAAPEENETDESFRFDFSDADPAAESLRATMSRLSVHVGETLRNYHQCLVANRDTGKEIFEALVALVERNFETLRKQLSATDGPRARRRLARVRSDLLFHSQSLVRRYKEEILPSQQANLDQGLGQLLTDLDSIVAEAPVEVTVFYEETDVEPSPGDSLRQKLDKFRKRLNHRILKKPISVRVRLRALIRFHLATTLREAVYEQLRAYGIQQYECVSDLQSFLHGVQDSVGIVESSLTGDPDFVLIEDELQRNRTRLERVTQAVDQQHVQYLADLLGANQRIMGVVGEELTRMDVNWRIRKYYRTGKTAEESKERILEVPALWARNQALVLNFCLIDSSLMAYRNRLTTITQKLRAELRLDIDNNVLEPLTELEATLKSVREGAELTRGKSDFVGLQEHNVLDDQVLLSGLTDDIRVAIDEIPETIEIITEESFQSIGENQYDEVNTLHVSLRRLIDYLTQTELIDPLDGVMAALPLRARKAVGAAKDVSRLLSLNLTESGAGNEVAVGAQHGSLSENLATAIHRLEVERAEMDEASRDVDNLIATRLTELSGKLSPYPVSRLASNLGHYLRKEESRKMLFGVVAGGRRVKTRIAKVLVSLLYRRSEGVLFARKLAESETVRRSKVDSILTLVEALSPRPEVLKTLPSYYRQLFLGRQSVGSEFLVVRGSEMQEAGTAIRRYREGYRGGLLVLAEPSAGKDTLCRSIVSKYLPRQNVYHLFPPPGGSIDPIVFRTRLREAVHSGVDVGTGPALPTDCVIVVNELELWWERSPGGMAVVDELVELIKAESERCFFIVNAVTDSFRFINNVRPIDDIFLSVIECKPFDAEDLQQAILLRHRASGLKFELNGQPEDQISELKLAVLFNRYFDFSAGSVGVAFEMWIAHIDKVEKDRLAIGLPERAALDPLEHLEADWVAWLHLFVLHRNLTVARLVRLFRSNEREIQNELAVLRRAGLIKETSQGVLEINPYLEPFLIRRLAEMGRP